MSSARSSKKKSVKPTGPNPEKRNRPDRERRIRQSARIARVLRILNLLQSRGRWTTKSIAEELECSERTVYRDLDFLEFSGVPYFREPTDGTIRVRPDFRFPVLNLNADELAGQAIATAISESHGLNITAGAKPTTAKLAAIVLSAVLILELIGPISVQFALKRAGEAAERSEQRTAAP